MRAFFCLSILGLALVSCSDSSKKDKLIIEEMKKSLNESNSRTAMNSAITLKTLLFKTYDAETSEKTNIWLPKAERINRLAYDCSKHIQDLKKYKQISRQQCDLLLQKLQSYEDSILNVDKKINLEFSQIRQFKNDSINKSFYDTHFKNITTNSSHAVLTNLQSKLRTLENKTIHFCNEMVGITGGVIFTPYQGMVGQNTNMLKQGDVLEVKAGVGYFKRHAKQEIIVNGTNLPVMGNGFAIYKKKINSKPGNYSLPVKIKYLNDWGIEETEIFTIKYAVAREDDQ